LIFGLDLRIESKDLRIETGLDSKTRFPHPPQKKKKAQRELLFVILFFHSQMHHYGRATYWSTDEIKKWWE